MDVMRVMSYKGSKGEGLVHAFVQDLSKGKRLNLFLSTEARRYSTMKFWQLHNIGRDNFPVIPVQTCFNIMLKVVQIWNLIHCFVYCFLYGYQHLLLIYTDFVSCDISIFIWIRGMCTLSVAILLLQILPLRFLHQKYYHNELCFWQNRMKLVNVMLEISLVLPDSRALYIQRNPYSNYTMRDKDTQLLKM